MQTQTSAPVEPLTTGQPESMSVVCDRIKTQPRGVVPKFSNNSAHPRESRMPGVTSAALEDQKASHPTARESGPNNGSEPVGHKVSDTGDNLTPASTKDISRGRHVSLPTPSDRASSHNDRPDVAAP
ncbi:hypothetical protein NM208_g1754 [Fusarium decemcellulare]|uniref:Uncharacterized protein n=1 Tax=Fusarium decemcellulare TaxID=57161 RepID=A0ACC1SV88_9HYPO|nr:hypothetical protein NM208_g1754 [Fusarium decemcellulare]